jgi:hypothetical protein
MFLILCSEDFPAQKHALAAAEGSRLGDAIVLWLRRESGLRANFIVSGRKYRRF